MVWGFHSIINATKCCPKSIRCPKTIESFSNELVKQIDMKAYGTPQVFRFGEGNKLGYTLIQPIETSCITAHFAEETDSVYFDCFSCKPFKEDDVINVMNKYFKMKLYNKVFLLRDIPLE